MPEKEQGRGKPIYSDDVPWRALKSVGLTFLDPSLRARGRIDKRWNLRVNVQVSAEAPT